MYLVISTILPYNEDITIHIMDATYSQIIDISIPLHTGMVIYPGNPSLEIEILKSASGTSVLSKITLGSHTGTHVDAPSHVFENAATLGQIPLSNVVGQCRVFDMTASVGSVSLHDIADKNIQEGERILFKTQNSVRGFDTFHDDFVFLGSDAATYLADKGVVCVGIDALSIKQRGSPDNTPHTALLEKNITIIEGLNLTPVSEGTYFLVALPLAFGGMDGSPVRAVLLA